MNERLKKGAAALAVILAFFLFFKLLLRLILPFVIAFLFAFVFSKPIKILHERTGIKKKLLGAGFVLAAVAAVGFAVFFIVSRLINELERFALSVSENAEKYVGRVFAFLDSLAEKIPFIETMEGNLSKAVSDAVGKAVSDLASKIPEFIAYLIGILPEILLFTVILIMASYYFCTDYERITGELFSLLPDKAVRFTKEIKRKLTDTGISYLKACLVLMLVTYAELLVGFLMLGIQYAFTLALIVAAVDMLPILGVGTVLLPWAAFAWLSGDSYIAVGLLIIFVTVTVVRRFAEPRVISSGIGLSPLTTLFAMYVGFRLFGFTGLFFSPLAAIMILLFLPENVSSHLGFRIKQEDKKENFSKNGNKISKST